MKEHNHLYFSKIITFIILLIGGLNINAQQIITGKIIDSENGTPLENVTIKDSLNHIVSISNVLGAFKLQKSGLYQIEKIGYQVKIEFVKSNYTTIQLELNPSHLSEIIVNAHHLPLKLKKANTTIDIVTSKDIERGNTTNPIHALNRVPSVFMQSGALNTNKISIRGIGSRNLYGTSKIRAYFLDIPLTSGNGETNIEDFELSTISRFEIIKGAGSSIYGAGLGGTIHLIPQSAYLNQTSFQTDISFGSFGLIKGLLNINHGTGKNSFKIIHSNTQSDGYRDNNKYNRQTFTINTKHFLSEKDDISFLASYLDLKAFIPSSIDKSTFTNNPKSAAFTWAQSKGYEDSQRGIFGSSWNHQYASNLKQITSIFTSFKKAYEPRPFNILTENTAAFGLRSRLLGSFKKVNWTLGGEFFKDTYTSRTFENLYQDFPVGTGSIKGDKLSDFKENRTYYNLFFETNYQASERTTFSLGLNFNKTSYNLLDQFVTNENPDQSGDYKFKAILSPKFGFSHLFTDHISIYGNISHGFSPPSTQETLLPDGLINTDIKPETGWNFEIGTRNAFFNNRLKLNLALYRLDVRNLLVTRRTGDDQFIGINAGRTTHDGLEIVLKYQWLESKTMSLNHYLTYTLNNFKFKEFLDNGDNFSGKKLTGVPSNLLNTGLDLDTKRGMYATINYQYVGRIPITDSNSLFSNSYSLTNIKLGYKHNINKHLKLNAYFGLDNIFNKHYASQILINAIGFGGTAPRYYYPGNPINYYTGINLSYMF
ncbi:TonB-dependent receptor [Algibacter sp. L4_22]|uniref:TonB-dependent receptor n=1 Tax=Algibacter sp. L4_22 TaxID=2942477 RepID=UPI00201B959F|nr:TonB-dependent receptor [Algibacter sp. L4_22]MCL5129900.1 TonB-dependent receptor [Algibacter sp. L4_22]